MDRLFDLGRQAFAVIDPYPVAQAVLIILAFIVLAKLTDWILSALVPRIVSRTDTDVDDHLVGIMHRPIFATVGMIGLVLATQRLGLSQDLEKITVAFVQSLLVLVWLVFGVRAARLAIGAMGKQERRFEFVQQTTEPLLMNLAAVVLFLGATYAILAAWDINVTGLIASAGIAGLALGFAAQDTLANLFAGVAILTDRPYKIGDYIIIDSGERGEVTHIGLRSTRLLTRDDVEVSIPNGVMGGAKIVNEAGGPPRRFRVRVSVGVAYGSDIDRVMQVLVNVATDHAKVLADPEPRTRFRRFGESSLDFDLLCWIVRPADRGLVLHELHCEIYRQLAAHGIQIPFPQRDVHIKAAPIPED